MKYSKNIVLPILIALTLCVIWGNSLMPSSLSGAFSDRINNLINTILGIIKQSSAQSSAGILRKIAHASEFAVLGVELTLLMYHKKNWPTLLLSGLSVAFIDETIQLFVPGRVGDIRDIWIDLAGFCIAAFLTFLLSTLHQQRHTHWVY